MISARTLLLGVIGHPIDHSLSPKMHNAAFVAEGMDYVYLPMEVRPEDLAVAVSSLRALGFRGFNVGMPHKQTILPLLNNIDDAARISGAVNTVSVENYELHGFNTDGSGFVEACKESNVEFADRRVLILGAGGAASAIAVALCAEGARKLQIVDQSTERAEELLGKLHELNTKTRVEAYSVETLDETALETNIIVNATPLGMRKDDPLPIPPDYLERNNAVCDAVYLPEGETALVRQARERGARIVPGRQMLLYQGVQAQRIWTGQEPNVKAMSDAIS